MKLIIVLLFCLESLVGQDGVWRAFTNFTPPLYKGVARVEKIITSFFLKEYMFIIQTTVIQYLCSQHPNTSV